MNYGGTVTKKLMLPAVYDLSTTKGLDAANAELASRCDFIPFAERRDWLTRRGWVRMSTERRVDAVDGHEYYVSWWWHVRLATKPVTQAEALRVQWWHEMEVEGLFEPREEV